VSQASATRTLAARTPRAVHIVGLNPALDRLQVVPTFTPFGVNRADDVVARAGGKSLIVARAIRRLGGDVVLHGFLGGPVADIIARECRAEGMIDRHVRIDGDTRTTVVIVETVTGRTTVINEPGPTVTDADMRRLESSLLSSLGPGDVIVLTGSLPPGAPVDFYAQVIDRTRALGVAVLVDASGEPLRHAAAAGPELLKINEDEFQELAAACDLAGSTPLVDAMQNVRVETGIGILIVTRGANGSVAVDESSVYRVSSPAVRTVNATGSGDAFFGALALTLSSDGPAALSEGLRIATAAGAANAVRLDPEVGPAAEVLALVDSVGVEVSALAAGTSTG
jgi:1-phosphofructokinase family hexose kinase